MRSHRLSRLALLTQGVALVGLGLSELACSKDPPPVTSGSEPPHMNAPPESPPPPKHVNAPETPPPDASTPLPPSPATPHHVNAPKPPDPPKKP